MFVASIIMGVLCIVALLISKALSIPDQNEREIQEAKFTKKVVRIVGLSLLSLGGIFFIFSLMVTVPVGNVGVTTLFGDVRGEPMPEGLHFINPLAKVTLFDCRKNTHKQTMGVPSRDQLITTFDISIQYRIDKSMAHKALSETGTPEQLINVHMIPKLRSIMREQGKTVEKTEDFFQSETQQRLQTTLENQLVEVLAPEGIKVSDVLIRSIRPPEVIMAGIQKKKLRTQKAEEQQEELKRFETEQQQKVAQAQAELDASEKKAKEMRIMADAKAYEILKINEAIAKNPAYIQLEALKTLAAMGKDPSTKIFFIDGNSPSPIPLMHMGVGNPVTVKTAAKK